MAEPWIRKNDLAAAFAPFAQGIDPPVTDLPLLKHTGTQLDMIEDIFHIQKYKGREATEESFKSLSDLFDILHIASHAIINNESPIHSNILFYPTDSLHDGRLQLWELYAMDIPASLAVLSACQTSDGKPLRGAGLMNIFRSYNPARGGIFW